MKTVPINKTSPSVLQASKWLQIQALLSSQEMEQLLKDIEGIKFYVVGKVISPGGETITKAEFLEKYEDYVSLLKAGQVPDATVFRPYFSSALTLADDHVFFIKAGENTQLVRTAKPVVQMQLHMMGYSAMEQKFRPMSLGIDSIHWGVQLSYPQLYLDAITKKIEKVLTNHEFPNTQLFRHIQSWIRNNTLPTPFFVDGKRINVPMRLGKECFEWINGHPQLRSLGIRVIKDVGERK